MNLTPSQQQILKDYLNKELTYRETYDELYDHISSGLENTPEGPSFEETVKNYVRKEFGGTQGLHLIEKRYSATSLSVIKKQYVQNIFQQLSFPQLLIWVIIAIGVYLALNASLFNRTWLVISLLIVSPSPIGKSIMPFIRQVFGKKVKPSVKKSGFFMIRFIPGMLLIILALYSHYVLNETPRMWLDNMSNGAITVLVMVYLLHIFSYYKIYLKELKVNMAG